MLRVVLQKNIFSWNESANVVFMSCVVPHSKNKVWSEKKFPRVCRYYVNSFSFCEISLKAVKSRHSELSKMVRQAHVVQKYTQEV